MNLTELEATAGRLVEEQERLKTIDAELAALSQEIKQDPKRNEKDKAFYELIGMDWSAPEHLSREAELKKERESVRESIKEAQSKVLDGVSSERLVIPLDPTPAKDEGTFTFKFRSGATFPKTVEELSTILGISTPLSIREVTIHQDKVVVRESDEYFAKKKIVDAFEDIRKTVKMKLSSQA